MGAEPFKKGVRQDWEGFVKCIRREGTPDRVHVIELFLDGVVRKELIREFKLDEGIAADDPYCDLKLEVRLQRFLGYDYVRAGIEGLNMPLNKSTTDDVAVLPQQEGRSYMDEHRGPITTWEEFESYPWPEPESGTTRALEWYQENLPDDMCIIGLGEFGHFAEYLTWLMGYETLCLSLYDNRDLVKAISGRLLTLYEAFLKRILQFDRVKVCWGSDDMGFRGGTLISPDDLREFVLPGHKLLAEISHDHDRPYILHSCGDLTGIMDDLIDDAGIDGKHSYEDVIEPVEKASEHYGDRIAILGGVDVDFLCRADEEELRSRVRGILETCMPDGGYCLGTGNSVANYIPLENYLTMLDVGRDFVP